MAKPGTLQFALGEFWKNYVGYGRASRSEYWWAVLFYNVIPFFLIYIVIGILTGIAIALESYAGLYFAIGLDIILSYGWVLATLVPFFCISARRLHDTNRSAWNLLWVLLPLVGAIILIVFFVQPGTPGKNKYGQARIK